MIVIGIDCAPGRPRPDKYMPEIFKLLNVKECEPVSKVFGAWTWHLDLGKSIYDKNQDAIMKYFNSLLSKGYIRGAMLDFIKTDYTQEEMEKIRDCAPSYCQSLDDKALLEHLKNTLGDEGFSKMLEAIL